MTIQITYFDGTTATIEAVESVRLVGLTRVEVQCFGNDPVVHREVHAVQVTYDGRK